MNLPLDRRHIFLALIATLMSGLISYYVDPFPAKLTIDIRTEKTSPWHIFYSSEKPFSQRNIITLYSCDTLKSGQYRIKLPKRGLKYLRLDPPEDFVLRSISIASIFHKTRIKGKKLFQRIKGVHHISDIQYKNGEIYGKVVGNDPYFEISSLPVVHPFPSWWDTVYWALLFSGNFILLNFLWKKSGRILGLIRMRGKYKKQFILLNLLLSLLIFALPPESYLYSKYLFFFVLVFVLPGLLVLRLIINANVKFGLFATFISSLVTSSSLFVLLLFLNDEAGLKTNAWLLYVTIILLLLLPNYLIRRAGWKFIQINYSSVWIWFFINVLLFVYIQPTKGLFVAPVHDPVANSLMAAFLQETSFASLPKYTNFYPPGLSYLIAFFSELSEIDAARSLLITTNIFNLLSGFSIALFLAYLFRKKYSFLFFVFVFTIVSGFYALLYFKAGKNSQIMGTFLFYGSMYLLVRCRKSDLEMTTLVLAVLTASILVHFNNILLTLFFVPAIWLHKYRRFFNPKEVFKQALKILLITIPFIIILGLNYLRITNHDSPASMNTGNVGIFNFLHVSLSFDSVISLFLRISHKIVVFYFALSGFILSIWIFIKQKNSRFAISLMWVFTCFFLYIINADFGVFSYFSSFNLFLFNTVFPALILIYLFEKIMVSRIKVIFVYLLLIWSAISLCNTYCEFQKARNKSSVRSADMIAFRWIKENTSKGEYFIPASMMRIKNRPQWAEQDAALYLPALAGRETAVAFFSNDVFSHYDSLMKAKYSLLIEHPDDTGTISFFLKRGIKYVYDGSYKPLGIVDVDPGVFAQYPINYRTVYDSLGVKIFEMKY